MAKKMLIDATHPEETRVVVADGNKVDDFDFESINKRQLAGNIYLAKVTRVEPSLQAAFVDYGGNRHGFLAFAEIHPDYYQIPVADREALLAEEAAEEEAARKAEERGEDDRGSDRKSRSRNRRDRSRDRDDSAPKGKSGSKKKAKADETSDSGGIRGLEVIEPEGDQQEETVTADISGLEIADTTAGGETEEQVSGGNDTSGNDDPHRTMSEDTGLGDESVTEEIAPDADTDTAERTETERQGEEATQTGGGQQKDDKPAESKGEEGDDGKSGEEQAAKKSGDKPRRRRRRRSSSRDEAASGGQESSAERGPDSDDDGETETEAEKPQVDEVGAEDLQEEVAEVRRTRRRRYKIQDVIKVRQIMLVQVVKEERGNKGAALTTYLSLAGRYCVLMPNTARGGGISRKITQATDRKRLRDIVNELDVPKGMGLIVRTAGAERTRAEIKRDYEFLLRQWEQVRELTLKSIAPTLIYEEGSLIKRAIRDLYSKEIDTILVEGEAGYREAKDYMKMLMPSHARNVQQYSEQIPLFNRFQVESYLNAMFNPTVQLKSGGYIVIGVTEALVAIDVNSGRSTKEGSIEETALKTNLEAADEVARQLRLRDLAGLIVIDFIDMDEGRNNRAVEKRMKDRLKSDRARIQVGRISPFGLMEMSRQRLRPGMLEATTQPCPHCHGQGIVRSSESLALAILRELEEEGVRARSAEVSVTVPVEIANYLINQKRAHLTRIEERYGLVIMLMGDPGLSSPNYNIERSRTASRPAIAPADVVITAESAVVAEEAPETKSAKAEAPKAPAADDGSDDDGRSRRRRGKRGGRRRRGGRGEGGREESGGTESAAEAGQEDRSEEEGEGRSRRRRRRRGRRDDGDASSSGGAEAASGGTTEVTETSGGASESTEPAAEPKQEEAAPAEPKREVAETAPEQPQGDQSPPESTPEPQAVEHAADEAEPAPGVKSAAAETESAPVESEQAEVAPEEKPEETVAESAGTEPAGNAPKISEEAPSPSGDSTGSAGSEDEEQSSKPKKRGWWMLR